MTDPTPLLPHLAPQALRSAFGRFMTGVVVVTTRDTTGEAVGFTANSFSSVSLDPPLLLVCPGKFLSSYQAFAGCQHFAISILSEDQQHVADIFARSKEDRFTQVPHHLNAAGIPLIDQAIVNFSCTTHHIAEAGDHAILIGQVEAMSQTEGRGLGYMNGQYLRLPAPQSTSAPRPAAVS